MAEGEAERGEAQAQDRRLIARAEASALYRVADELGEISKATFAISNMMQDR
jgi:hypothetical protein